MAVSNEIVKITYTGNNSTTTFAIPFAFQANSEIRVVLRDETNLSAITETLQVLTTNYTLTGGPPVTDVEMNTAPTTTQKLIVRRLGAITQPTDYIETGTFPAETHEEALDRATLRSQELQEQLNRSALLSETEQVIAGPLTIPDPVINNLLGWNATGLNLKNFTATEITNLSLGPDLSQTSAVILNNQSGAANVVGMTLDAASFSSGIYFVEYDRPADTDLFANGLVFLQRVSGVWRLSEIIFDDNDIDGGKPAGVLLSVTEAGGIAQVQYTTTDLTGGTNGTLLFKPIRFTV